MPASELGVDWEKAIQRKFGWDASSPLCQPGGGGPGTHCRSCFISKNTAHAQASANCCWGFMILCHLSSLCPQWLSVSKELLGMLLLCNKPPHYFVAYKSNHVWLLTNPWFAWPASAGPECTSASWPWASWFWTWLIRQLCPMWSLILQLVSPGFVLTMEAGVQGRAKVHETSWSLGSDTSTAFIGSSKPQAGMDSRDEEIILQLLMKRVQNHTAKDLNMRRSGNLGSFLQWKSAMAPRWCAL